MADVLDPLMAAKARALAALAEDGASNGGGESPGSSDHEESTGSKATTAKGGEKKKGKPRRKRKAGTAASRALAEQKERMAAAAAVAKVKVEDVVIEYVAPSLEDELKGEAFSAFADVFKAFAAAGGAEGEASSVGGNGNGDGDDKKAFVSAASEASSYMSSMKKQAGLAGDEDDSTGGGGGGGGEANSDTDSDGEGKSKLSKRKFKQLNRLSVAELKQLVARPDVVEAHDVTAADPRLLVHLKGYRNTVPVPRHWSRKRKYLMNKRGVDKIPYKLPEFIEATGISKIRGALAEKEADKTLKQQARAVMHAKMGRSDIDYQVLHDAFFRYQTKPKLTIHGDLYFEGKELEVNMTERRPGVLSEELREALGMPDNAPPPWLINMQRYGPPPSYPNLKIPGLNAPIPPGCSFGYMPGQWGKPPVDELNNPLYGDVFGLAATEANAELFMAAPVQKVHWGLLPDEEEDDGDDDSDSGGQGDDDDNDDDDDDDESGGRSTVSGLATGDGRATSASTFAGLATPDTIELRKSGGDRTPMASGLSSLAPGEVRPLYRVLQQTEASVGSALVGSSHTYVIPSEGDPKLPRAKDRLVNVSRSSAGLIATSSNVDITLNPEELASLNPDMLKEKYESERLAEKAGGGGSLLSGARLSATEDVSDIVAAGLAEQARKARKRKAGKDGEPTEKRFKF